MPTIQPRRTLDELASLSTAIFDRQVRPQLKKEDDGKFVAIDVVSSDFELDEDDYTAVTRLRTRKPESDIWLMRAGYPTTYRIGVVR